MNKIRVITIFEPITKKMFEELNQIFKDIALELSKHMQQNLQFATHSTTAYFEYKNRCFKGFIKIKLMPEFEITRQDITEVTEVEMQLGIEAEKAKTNTTTYWKEVETDE